MFFCIRKKIVANHILTVSHHILVCQGILVAAHTMLFALDEGFDSGVCPEEVGGALDGVGECSPCTGVGIRGSVHIANIFLEAGDGELVFTEDAPELLDFGLVAVFFDGFSVGFDG